MLIEGLLAAEILVARHAMNRHFGCALSTIGDRRGKTRVLVRLDYIIIC
jgi:hypothetical protein